MEQNIIVTNQLTKVYKGTPVVDNVSISVPKGSITGLIGRNGAGKTTLLRLLTGLIKPTSGAFELLPNQQRTSTSVSAIVERGSMAQSLTAYDNLVIQCKLLGISYDKQYIQDTLSMVGLADVGKKKVKDFSLGMRQRLSIAMVIVGKPQLLLLDEPINALDPQGISELRQLLQDINAKLGVTILISSHILAELDKLATHFIIMEKGKVLSTLTSEQLANMGKHSVRLTVSDANKAQQILASKGITNITIQQGNIMVVYDDVPSTKLLLYLAEKDIEVKSVNTQGDSLEDIYLNIVGGRHD